MLGRHQRHEHKHAMGTRKGQQNENQMPPLFHHSSDRRFARRYRKMRFLATGEESDEIDSTTPIHINAVNLPCGSEKHIRKIILSQSPLLPQLPLDQRSK